ncbi:MAG TPA: hypothetical protein VJS11_02655 [Acidobacteriaceae bacterium]|nr:hypothetical protein [Acidobacteriaceae bacterium]
MKSREAIRKASAGVWAFAVVSLLLWIPSAIPCAAQTTQATTQSSPATQGAKTATPVRRVRRRRRPTGPPSLSSQKATPPQVTLDHGKLMVNAQNSDLSAILQDVSQKSGMSVDGLTRNTRVFGVYGPGSPRDVLSALLTGAGYNFVMAGGESGSVPRELVLTAQNGSALPANPARPAQPQPAASANENPGAEDNEPQQPLGPGAIAHPSPQSTDQTDPQTRMQRHLDTLRHMQETIQQQQQQQHQQNPPQNPPPNPPQ